MSGSSKNASAPKPSIFERAVIWIDSAPLIKAEHEKYLAALKRLNTVQERLDFHTKSDEPKYSYWLNTEFADELSDIRALHRKYFELESILAWVETYVREEGCSSFEGYQAYLEEQKQAEMAERLREKMNQREQERREAGESTEGSSEEAESGNADSWEREERRRAEERERAREDHSQNRKSSKKAEKEDTAIKQIYRQLARRLHPDINGNLSLQETEMWFDVQEAYEARDLARLEQLLAIADRAEDERNAGSSESAKVGKIQSLGRLKAMLKNLATKLRTTQRSLSKAKTSVAWDFHKVKQDPRRLSKLRTDITVELAQVERGIGADVYRFEKVIARWERGLEKERSRSAERERDYGRNGGRGSSRKNGRGRFEDRY